MKPEQTVPVHPANADAWRAWDGADGEYWTRNEDTFNRSIADHHRRFLEAATITPTDRVLDIGCGTGQTTRDAAALARQGSALGVDLSAAMLDRARQRAAEQGLTNVRFEQADAQIFPFEAGGFDVAISRTGVMFFGDPVAAFRNIAHALRPGGRLTLLTWQAPADNEWIWEILRAVAADRQPPSPPPGAPGPFSLADPDRVRGILSAAGYTDIRLDDVRLPMYFGPDADAASRFLAGRGPIQSALRDLGPDAREAAFARLRANIEDHTGPDGVQYGSAAWVITGRTVTTP